MYNLKTIPLIDVQKPLNNIKKICTDVKYRRLFYIVLILFFLLVTYLSILVWFFSFLEVIFSNVF